jgi:hypothetical protein
MFLTHCQKSLPRRIPNQLCQLPEELQVAAKARGNSPGPDGIVAEFYTYFSDLIGEEFCHMIKSATEKGHLPKESTKGWLHCCSREVRRKD